MVTKILPVYLRSIAVAAVLLLVTKTAYGGAYEINYIGVSDASFYGDVFVTTTNTLIGGAFTITGISGTRGTDKITGLSPYALSDQQLFAGDPRFDLAGMSFTTESAGDFNLYTYQNSYYELSSHVDPTGYAWNGTQIKLTVKDIAEPASLALLATGLLGLGHMLRRKRPGHQN